MTGPTPQAHGTTGPTHQIHGTTGPTPQAHGITGPTNQTPQTDQTAVTEVMDQIAATEVMEVTEAAGKIKSETKSIMEPTISTYLNTMQVSMDSLKELTITIIKEDTA